MTKQKMIFAILAFAALAGAEPTAQAATAFATSNVNVRSGPSTSYSIVGSLDAGTRVELNGCRDGWCSVEQGNLRGWANKDYLDQARATVIVVAPPIIIHRPYRPHQKPPFNRPRCKISPGIPCR